MKHKPKLGQNFLTDASACAAIADALGDLSNATVIEIGPGAGAITALLAARARRVVAIEIDPTLAAALRRQFPAIEVVEADILTADWNTLRRGEEPLRVVGNLPYYITSPILMRLFEHSEAIGTAVVTMQREVADRVAATPGSRDYGLLSAMAQIYARVERVLALPPDAFMPPPEVHSTVLRLTMKPRFVELGVAPEPFLSLLKLCFAQKRKTLAKNLRTAGFDSEQVVSAMEHAGIEPRARAEELGLEAMAALSKALPPRG